jgi:hypothetical protein
MELLETTAPAATFVEPAADPVAELLAAAPLAPRPRPRDLPGVVLGTLCGWDEFGRPVVGFPDAPAAAPLPALTTVALQGEDAGREVVLTFVEGDPMRPLIVGLLQVPAPAPPKPQPVATVDGERLEFSAEKEIVLRCGQASLTLTRAGKILLSGTYVLSRSSGVNRIKGGSVQIN